MKKLLHLLLIPLVGICFHTIATAQLPTITGVVTSSTDGQPLPGVNVIIKGTTQGATTNAEGRFSIEANQEQVLVFSFIGYAPQEVLIGNQTTLAVVLVEDITTLGEVAVFATGYEQLPKERATGSFVQADRELLNRRVSTNVLDRLEDVASGVIFNRQGSASDAISIRGRSTLFANANPLIVIDNFPYDGDLGNINPNDVESITVLKDAAAASIWGARAGNGVIVITTKKGTKNGPEISFNANVTVGEKNDAFYLPVMTTADYIDTEVQLFASGYYTALENSYNKRALTPVVELLIAERDGDITTEELHATLAAWKQRDVRDDFDRYLYQHPVNQQYAINLRGGTDKQHYVLGAGYDHNLGNLAGNTYGRVTLNMKNNWLLLRDKLTVSTDLYFTRTNASENGIDPSSLRMSVYDNLYPYAQLADAGGQPLAIVQDYREGFKRDAEALGLLDWSYKPLAERQAVTKTLKQNDYRINTALRYTLMPGLTAEALYQHWSATKDGRQHYSPDSYFTRNLINQYTQNTSGKLTYPIPQGGILDESSQTAVSHNFRAQLNYTKTIGNHALHGLAGYEVKEVNTTGGEYRHYGYNDNLARSTPVDYGTLYSQYYYPFSSARIPNIDQHTSLTDRFVSYYGNAGYTYQNRYTLTLSARKDQSNLFGVEANQKGVPLWSAGTLWSISDEPFYHVGFMPLLKLRMTYGYNGNIDKTVTAFTTAQTYGTNSTTGLPYARIMNPPNPALQWEKIRMINVGLDVELFKGNIVGSIEYYQKNGESLIGFVPVAPSTGVSRFKGNTSATRSHGVDLVLNTKNINRAFSWQTQFLYSTNHLKVTDYQDEAPALYLVNYGDIGNYVKEGNTLFGVYSYRWAGLDPAAGDPQGYLEGNVSKDYTRIVNEAKPDDLEYHGAARPTTFGSVRNTFSWHHFSLSFNISYRFGYYFRTRSIVYGNNLGLGGHGDYYNRWQQPGDENHTHVPAIPAGVIANRDQFYTYSSALVEKGDHIRLQDIQLSYTVPASGRTLPFTSAQVYAYVNNIGLLWKATDQVKDPDYNVMPPVRTYAIGLKIDF